MPMLSAKYAPMTNQSIIVSRMGLQLGARFVVRQASLPRWQARSDLLSCCQTGGYDGDYPEIGYSDAPRTGGRRGQEVPRRREGRARIGRLARRGIAGRLLGLPLQLERRGATSGR